MAGAFKKRITLETYAEIPDSFGDAAVGQYTTLARRWASVTPLRGRELALFQQTHADVSHRILMRYDSTISTLTPKDRASLGSRNFDILSVINKREANREIELMCKENI